MEKGQWGKMKFMDESLLVHMSAVLNVETRLAFDFRIV